MASFGSTMDRVFAIIIGRPVRTSTMFYCADAFLFSNPPFSTLNGSGGKNTLKSFYYVDYPMRSVSAEIKVLRERFTRSFIAFA